MRSLKRIKNEIRKLEQAIKRGPRNMVILQMELRKQAEALVKRSSTTKRTKHKVVVQQEAKPKKGKKGQV